MALNIKNPMVERLAAEIVAATGESKTEAIRVALVERKQRLALQLPQDHRQRRIQGVLDEIWATIPDDVCGKTLTREEEDRILGYGPDGV